VARRLILVELNEVPFRVLDAYATWRPRSTLARLLARSRQYETRAEDRTDRIPHGKLSPWITWPTLHRGVPHLRHGITHLGQDTRAADRAVPPLWRILRARGLGVGVMGSLHTHPLPPDVRDYAFYLPDTFAPASDAWPRRLETFQDFNLTMARESARNVSGGVRPRPALRLLGHAPGLGLRARTLADVARQLGHERLRPTTRARRRTYQAVLAFDVWLRQLETTRPHFATFFTNHVASALHRFWAATFPKDYDEFECSAEWVASYRDEIPFALDKLDAGLARLVRFVDACGDARLVLTSSMGQAATRARSVRTQLYATDLSRLMAALGLHDDDWIQRPAMAPDVSVFVAPHALDRFRASVRELCVAGEPVRCDERERGFASLVFGQVNLDESERPVRLRGRPVELAEVGLANVEIQEGAGSTAYHVPEGHLLVYEPGAAPDPRRTPVSTLEIAPFALSSLGVEPPAWMRRDGALLRNDPPRRAA